MKKDIDNILHSTVRIESVTTKNLSFSGTGFFYKFLDNGKTFVPAIVTNKHVIRESKTGYLNLTRKNCDGSPSLDDPVKLEIDDFESCWIKHPDPNIDLAICPIAPILNQAKAKNFDFYYESLVSKLIPSEDVLLSLSVMEEIIMIGYPSGVWDTQHNLPILRRGITATHPRIDLNGKKEFLIDAACLQGSSGSPIILYNQKGYPTEKGRTKILLLGILYAATMYSVQRESIVPHLPTEDKIQNYQKIPTNLGFVTKASNLKVFNSILSKKINQ